MQVQNDILLPIETSNRELDGKLLLALFAAEAGFRCHIGVMSRIQSPGFPSSIYVSKSVRFSKQVKLMADLGHLIVAWDEEGLARFNDTVHGARIEPTALQLPSLLFSWGKSNSDLWRQHPYYDGRPIIDVGNPRVDLLRRELHPIYREKVASYRDRYGPFALLNSNFGIVNHYKVAGRKAKIGAKSHDPAAFAAFRRGVEAHKRKLFEAFLSAIPTIAGAIAPYRLVVRPHPSEDHAAWQRVAGGLDNVSVVYEGPVVPWQLAASCLIHNGCTSAVEASVLRLPALAYRPVSDDEFDIALPNALSENFTDIQKLGARARDCLENSTTPDAAMPYSALLRDNIASLDGPLSCERIVGALQQLSASNERSGASLITRMAARGRYSLRQVMHSLAHEKRRYEQHKSDAVEFTVEKIAARAKPMSEALQRFGNIRFETRAPGIVTIFSGG